MKDVYQLLIDVYRMRMEDQYVFEGECDLDSIYGGRASSKKGFRHFLRRAEKAHGVFPSWWDEGKAIECENAGMCGGWSSLTSMVEKSDIVEHYGDLNMPMQLRMLGEQIYGRGLGGHDGIEIIQLMKSTEYGEMMLDSGLLVFFNLMNMEHVGQDISRKSHRKE